MIAQPSVAVGATAFLLASGGSCQFGGIRIRAVVWPLAAEHYRLAV